MSSKNAGDAISAALAVIGDRWSLLVLRGVFRGSYRFGELRDELGIASNLLTDRLCRLVEDGVLEKVLYQERPERFEYRLTDAGRDLSPVLVALLQWGDAHAAAEHGERTTLVHAGCDGQVENVTRCADCNEVLDATQIRAKERIHNT